MTIKTIELKLAVTVDEDEYQILPRHETIPSELVFEIRLLLSQDLLEWEGVVDLAIDFVPDETTDQN